MTTLQQQLRSRRQALKLTQAQVAERMGIGQADVANLEAARRDPTLRTLTLWAQALDARIGIVEARPRRAKNADQSAPV